MKFIKFLLLFVLFASSATAQDPHSGENPGTSVFAPIVPTDPETGDELDQTARVEELKDYVSLASDALSAILVPILAAFFAFFVIKKGMGWAGYSFGEKPDNDLELPPDKFGGTKIELKSDFGYFGNKKINAAVAQDMAILNVHAYKESKPKSDLMSDFDEGPDLPMPEHHEKSAKRKRSRKSNYPSDMFD